MDQQKNNGGTLLSDEDLEKVDGGNTIIIIPPTVSPDDPKAQQCPICGWTQINVTITQWNQKRIYRCPKCHGSWE